MEQVSKNVFDGASKALTLLDKEGAIVILIFVSLIRSVVPVSSPFTWYP